MELSSILLINHSTDIDEAGRGIALQSYSGTLAFSLPGELKRKKILFNTAGLRAGQNRLRLQSPKNCGPRRIAASSQDRPDMKFALTSSFRRPADLRNSSFAPLPAAGSPDSPRPQEAAQPSSHLRYVKRGVLSSLQSQFLSSKKIAPAEDCPPSESRGDRSGVARTAAHLTARFKKLPPHLRDELLLQKPLGEAGSSLQAQVELVLREDADRLARRLHGKNLRKTEERVIRKSLDLKFKRLPAARDRLACTQREATETSPFSPAIKPSNSAKKKSAFKPRPGKFAIGVSAIVSMKPSEETLLVSNSVYETVDASGAVAAEKRLAQPHGRTPASDRPAQPLREDPDTNCSLLLPDTLRLATGARAEDQGGASPDWPGLHSQDSPKIAPQKQKGALLLNLVDSIVSGSAVCKAAQNPAFQHFSSGCFQTAEGRYGNIVVHYGYLGKVLGVHAEGLAEKVNGHLATRARQRLGFKNKFADEAELRKTMRGIFKDLSSFLCELPVNLLFTGVAVSFYCIYRNKITLANCGRCQSKFLEMPDISIDPRLSSTIQSLFLRPAIHAAQRRLLAGPAPPDSDDLSAMTQEQFRAQFLELASKKKAVKPPPKEPMAPDDEGSNGVDAAGDSGPADPTRWRLSAAASMKSIRHLLHFKAHDIFGQDSPGQQKSEHKEKLSTAQRLPIPAYQSILADADKAASGLLFGAGFIPRSTS